MWWKKWIHALVSKFWHKLHISKVRHCCPAALTFVLDSIHSSLCTIQSVKIRLPSNFYTLRNMLVSTSNILLANTNQMLNWLYYSIVTHWLHLKMWKSVSEVPFDSAWSRFTSKYTCADYNFLLFQQFDSHELYAHLFTNWHAFSAHFCWSETFFTKYHVFLFVLKEQLQSTPWKIASQTHIFKVLSQSQCFVN